MKEIPDRIGRTSSEWAEWKGYEINNPASSIDVERAIKCALDACPSGAVGLNYTGGTKSMAVHAHKTARTWENNTGRRVVFTYLDANTLTLHRDDNATPCFVQHEISLTIEKLLSLHGLEVDEKQPLKKEPHLSELCKVLAETHQNRDAQEEYDRWCSMYLRHTNEKDIRIISKVTGLYEPGTREESQTPKRPTNLNDAVDILRRSQACSSKLVEKRNQFPHKLIPFPDAALLCRVKRVMQTTFGVDVDVETFDPSEIIKNKSLNFSTEKDLVKFLDGEWMESWTLACFKEIEAQNKVNDLAMTLRITTAPYDFEFDVVALQGYQLHAVSCTRSNDHHLCKSKLFEAYVRAKQLGGDEAKIGLVCCAPNPSLLQDQVIEAWRAKREHVKVFGPADLPYLANKLKEWLKPN